MKAPLSLDVSTDKFSQFLALIPALVLVFYPALVKADSSLQRTDKSALYFEVKTQNSTTVNPVNGPFLTYDEVLRADPEAVHRQQFNELFKQRLSEYLAKRGSPLANHVDHLLTKKGYMEDGWIRILAISHVESHMCKHIPRTKNGLSYNCSGIRRGGQYMQYPSFDGWLDDMDKVVNSNYKGRSFAQMNCRYVQPCNSRWVNGATGIYNELKSLEAIAYVETAPKNVGIATAEVELKK
jgi:hypothetical protein